MATFWSVAAAAFAIVKTKSQITPAASRMAVRTTNGSSMLSTVTRHWCA
jgi:hypothetical protein